jgi:hypothetical protein
VIGPSRTSDQADPWSPDSSLQPRNMVSCKVPGAQDSSAPQHEPILSEIVCEARNRLMARGRRGWCRCAEKQPVVTRLLRPPNRTRARNPGIVRREQALRARRWPQWVVIGPRASVALLELETKPLSDNVHADGHHAAGLVLDANPRDGLKIEILNYPGLRSAGVELPRLGHPM